MSAPDRSRKRIAVLISGRGSNMAALLRNDCGGDVVVVGSNKADAKGLDVARDAGIATFAISHRDYANREAFDAALVTALNEFQPDLVVLAGFMRILTPVFVNAFAGRLINIHPSLLPSFPGLDTHERALADGVKLHGCTVHFVTTELDHGPIVKQSVVPVLPADTVETLSARILAEEHKTYAEAVALLLSGEFRIENRRIVES